MLSARRAPPQLRADSVIIVEMLWETLQSFVSFVEVIAAVTAILIGGLLIAMITCWALSQIFRKLSGAPVEPDPDEYDLDSGLPPALFPNPPNEAVGR